MENTRSSGRQPIRVVITQYRPTENWLRSKPEFEDFEFYTTFKEAVGSVARLGVGDVVCGSFSHILASAICKTGSEYWHIHVRRRAFKNPDYIGVDQLDDNAYVTRYFVRYDGPILQPPDRKNR